MDPRIERHRPSEAEERRAAADGVDLEALKREAPVEYMVRNAASVLTVAPALAHLAAGMLLAAFPEREVFRSEGDDYERVLAFPPLTPDELRRFDGLLVPLVERPEWRSRHAFYREVNDVRGLRRELGLPQAPGDYDGTVAVVGPFDDEGEADAWGRASVTSPRTYDPFPMNGYWFCDVFLADAV